MVKHGFKPKHRPAGGLANWRWIKDIPFALPRLVGGLMERSTLPSLKITTAWGGTRFLTPWHIVLLFRMKISNYFALEPEQQFLFSPHPFCEISTSDGDGHKTPT